MSQHSTTPTPPAGTDHGTHLTLWDAASLIIGIVIGTSIFRASPAVFANSPSAGAGLWLFVLGGVLSVVGALCYCELATAYPRAGGDYVYLTHAFGPWAGFLFAWTRFTVVLPANIGVMAYAFADYAVPVFHVDRAWSAVIAVAAVVALTATNVCGMAFGKQVQNVLSVAKIVALLTIIVAGFSVPDAGSVRDGSAAVVRSQDIAVAPEDERNEFRSTEAVTLAQVGVALVLILYAYGGWGDAVFVAAEVRNLQRNVPRALLLGMGGITLLYVGVNAAYLAALGLDGLRSATTPASDVLQLAWGPAGGRSIGLIVMLSALGAINGMLFAGSRVVMSMGEDYRLLSVLGGWDPRRRAPVPALIALGLMSVLLVVLVGTETGHRAWNAVLSSAGLTGMKWDPRSGGFEMLIVSMSPTFWALFVLTAVAVVVLRAKDARRPRPFRIPLYPLPPILFGLTSAYMLYSSAAYAQALNLIGVVPLAVGLVLYAVSAHPSGAGRGE